MPEVTACYWKSDLLEGLVSVCVESKVLGKELTDIVRSGPRGDFM